MQLLKLDVRPVVVGLVQPELRLRPPQLVVGLLQLVLQLRDLHRRPDVEVGHGRLGAVHARAPAAVPVAHVVDAHAAPAVVHAHPRPAPSDAADAAADAAAHAGEGVRVVVVSDAGGDLRAAPHIAAHPLHIVVHAVVLLSGMVNETTAMNKEVIYIKGGFYIPSRLFGLRNFPHYRTTQ